MSYLLEPRLPKFEHVLNELLYRIDKSLAHSKAPDEVDPAFLEYLQRESA